VEISLSLIDTFIWNGTALPSDVVLPRSLSLVGDLERDRLLEGREAVGGIVEVDDSVPIEEVSRLVSVRVRTNNSTRRI